MQLFSIILLKENSEPVTGKRTPKPQELCIKNNIITYIHKNTPHTGLYFTCIFCFPQYCLTGLINIYLLAISREDYADRCTLQAT